MIDLRSDTVTKPTGAMRATMAAADVGDDVYGDDPTVNELEARVADVLGKEDAVFVPTGSMSNQIAIKAHTQPGDLVLIDRLAHIIRAEGGAGAVVSGVTMGHLTGVRGSFTVDDVEGAMEPGHRFNPTTLNTPPTLLVAENTNNGGGGAVWPLEQLQGVCAAAKRHGLATHLDGARLWHATAATGVSEREYAAPFDTVNVCFSKGLGAPVGSALVGTKETIARARRFKQMLGGGFRQAGIIAAGALHALEHHRSGLPADVEHARLLAEGLNEMEGVDVEVASVESNIIRFEVNAMPAGEFADACHGAGLHMLPNGDHGMRAIAHRDVGRADVLRALEIMTDVLAGQASDGPKD